MCTSSDFVVNFSDLCTLQTSATVDEATDVAYELKAALFDYDFVGLGEQEEHPTRSVIETRRYFRPTRYSKIVKFLRWIHGSKVFR
jgi:hypothetical protein